MPRCYILKGREIEETDLMTWGRFFDGNEESRRIGRDEIGDYLVSTVFLGLDHGFGGEPLLFETMVFGPDCHGDVWCERCATYEEAEAMHQRGCAYVRDELPFFHT